jgi:hypothetical protein
MFDLSLLQEFKRGVIRELLLEVVRYSHRRQRLEEQSSTFFYDPMVNNSLTYDLTDHRL